MAALQTFEQYLTTSAINLNISEVIIALILAAALSYVVSKVYIKYSTVLSNKEKFADNFLLLATTTTLIIMIVKSSLALSLGLVGALSIVRFRAAIKEPEELGFLFLNISIGLGLGASQVWTTIIAIFVICGLYILKQKSKKDDNNQNLCFTITSLQPEKVKLNDIIKILKKHSNYVHLKRFDVTEKLIEASFFINPNSITELTYIKENLEKISKSIKLTYIDRE